MSKLEEIIRVNPLNLSNLRSIAIGKVVAISISKKKGIPKSNVQYAKLIENFGIEGDIHAGNWHRQVSFLALESIEKMREKGLHNLRPGAFAENITTEMIRTIYKEFIREAIFDNISDEIPYESDVIIDKIDEDAPVEHIRATIIVEKDSQKGIIIGKGGAAIKRIGQNAREKIERLASKPVYLELFVSVKKGWTTDKKFLSDLGYEW